MYLFIGILTSFYLKILRVAYTIKIHTNAGERLTLRKTL